VLEPAHIFENPSYKSKSPYHNLSRGSDQNGIMVPPIIQSERLTLVLLTDTTPDSQHLKWFHENWTDPDATSWSISGASTSMDDSRARMLALVAANNYFYSVFAKRPEGAQEQGSSTHGDEGKTPGVHVGSVGLRTQASGPTIPALPAKAEDAGKTLDLRILGYAYFKHAWGKGYATEAARALLDAYAASVAEEKARGEKVFYVEAGVDEGNPASAAIVQKLGFERVGFKEEKEPVFLAGAWRYDGYWINGMYV
jgi:RimJ/RimL family protein N-acetyltransferase